MATDATVDIPAVAQKQRLVILLPSPTTIEGLQYWILMGIGIFLPVLLHDMVTSLVDDMYQEVCRNIVIVFGAFWWMNILLYGHIQVQMNQVSGILCFGQYVIDGNPGLILFIPGLMRVSVDDGSMRNFEAPGPQDKIFHGTPENNAKQIPADQQPLPPGMVRPMRIETGAPGPGIIYDKVVRDAEGKIVGLRTEDDKAENYTDDPRHTALTLEVHAYGILKISQKYYRYYLANTKRAGSKNIEDVMAYLQTQFVTRVKSAIFKSFKKRTPASIINNLEIVDAEVKADVENFVEIGDPHEIGSSWGMDIILIGVDDIDLTKKMSTALRDRGVAGVAVQTARKTKEKTIIDAEATKEQKKLVGQGDADAFKSMKEAEAAGIEAIQKAKAIGIEAIAEKISKSDKAQLVAQLQLAAEMVEKAQFALIPEGNIFGTVGGMKLLEKTIDDLTKKKGTSE